MDMAFFASLFLCLLLLNISFYLLLLGLGSVPCFLFLSLFGNSLIQLHSLYRSFFLFLEYISKIQIGYPTLTASFLRFLDMYSSILFQISKVALWLFFRYSKCRSLSVLLLFLFCFCLIPETVSF